MLFFRGKSVLYENGENEKDGGGERRGLLKSSCIKQFRVYTKAVRSV